MIAGKDDDVPGVVAGRLTDSRMYLRGLSACVVCVVLDQAFDLPRWHP
jgi:hypothetical protein